MDKTMADRLDDRQARREGQSGETGGETMHVPVNMYRSEDAVVVVAPLPGVMPGDVAVTLEDRKLSIRASMRSPAPKEYLIHEWHYGPFEREVEVPEGFGANAKASFGNGQLAVSLGRGEAPGGRVELQPTGR